MPLLGSTRSTLGTPIVDGCLSTENFGSFLFGDVLLQLVVLDPVHLLVGDVSCRDDLREDSGLEDMSRLDSELLLHLADVGGILKQLPDGEVTQAGEPLVSGRGELGSLLKLLFGLVHAVELVEGLQLDQYFLLHHLRDTRLAL